MVMNKNFATFLQHSGVFMLLLCIASTHTAATAEKTLRAKIVTGNDRWSRPVDHVNDVINVTFAAAIYQIVDFDAKAETLSTLMWPLICWNDINIRWNPEENGGIDLIRINQNEIWVPDLVPYNDVGSWDTEKYKNLIPLFARSDGKVCWMFPTIMETICTMDVYKFPYDMQRCQVQLGSWQYCSAEVQTQCLHEDLDMSAFTPNSHWQLTS